MRSFLKIGLMFTLAFVFIQCAEPPTEEINAAQSALDEAKRAQADTYAADTYNSARTTLDDARTKVEQGDYEAARASAVRARDLANQAKSQAEANMQKMRDEAQAIINRVSSGLTDARTAISNAPQGKGADEDLDQLRTDLGQAEASINDARNNLSNNPRSAVEQSKSAESKLSQVQGAVQTAMQKIEAWKEKHRPWYEL